MKHEPDFRRAEFLQEHLLQTQAFYDDRCVDPTGGLYQFYKDDGSVYDAATRHLVSSTRFVVTHANLARRFPEHARAADWLATARHALRFVQEVHRDPNTGGYAWQLRWQNSQKTVMDAQNHCYSLAFVLLAHAQALRAGIEEARAGLFETVALMEKRFWEPASGLYADEAAPDWALTPYRGQNANMHACEAMLAAFEATGDADCLKRAETLARSVTQRLAAHGGGWIWEHFHTDWTPDWDYNRHDPANLFRPWGFQVGHQTEWAKLLLTLERNLGVAEDDDSWMLLRARELFGTAALQGWDRAHRGLVYGLAPGADPGSPREMQVCDGEKYHWVQAESFAAAAALAHRTHDGAYWEWYDRIWDYCWAHFVDHQHGAWFRILSADNRKVTDEKSPAGKVDYHNMGACHEVLDTLAR